MAAINKSWRIFAALTLAVVLIAGAYVVARSAGHPSIAEASTETALLAQIASKDSDSDGLPDWEESLYGTDPHVVDTKNLGMSDGEAVAKGLIVPEANTDVPLPPAQGGTSGRITELDGVQAPAAGSLTDTFAKNFFTLYLSAKQAKNGADLTEEESAQLADQAVTQMISAIGPVSDFKKATDLTVSGSGPEALRAFAIAAEQVLIAHPNNAPKSELLYLQDAVQNKDDSAIARIQSLAKTYHETAAGFATLVAPQELSEVHLKLVNVLARIGSIADDFARVNTDPLATMLALTQYPQAILALGNAFIDINTIYRSANVSFSKGEQGYAFVNVIPNVAERQKAEAATP